MMAALHGDLVAVLDVGKTTAKLLVASISTGEPVASIETACRPSTTAWGDELPVREIEEWACAALAALPDRRRIGALVPIAHGAAAVLVDGAGETLVAPDYEDARFDLVAEEYRPLRDDFRDTFSPFLPVGLNLGRQLYFLQTRHATLFAKARRLLTYPQYWAWRFSGVAASEVTSLGCHSDLWQPVAGQPSLLTHRRNWAPLLPPLRRANEALGPITPRIAAATGLHPECQVFCGMHDSNASFLCHRIARPDGDAFAVVSSGTWTIVLAHGTPLEQLQESQDMLANVDAFGQPIATARFMGGREYEMIAGPANGRSPAQRTDLEAVIARRAFAMPSFSSTGGPYARHRGELRGADGFAPAQNSALATLYLALMTDLLLDRLECHDDCIVDGPLAADEMFAPLLAALRVGSGAVFIAPARSAALTAGRYVAGGFAQGMPHGPGSAARPQPIAPLEVAGAARYRDEWRRRLPD